MQSDVDEKYEEALAAELKDLWTIRDQLRDSCSLVEMREMLTYAYSFTTNTHAHAPTHTLAPTNSLSYNSCVLFAISCVTVAHWWKCTKF